MTPPPNTHTHPLHTCTHHYYPAQNLPWLPVPCDRKLLFLGKSSEAHRATLLTFLPLLTPKATAASLQAFAVGRSCAEHFEQTVASYVLKQVLEEVMVLIPTLQIRALGPQSFSPLPEHRVHFHGSQRDSCSFSDPRVPLWQGPRVLGLAPCLLLGNTG